ncbi:hypothetical protein PUN28_005728 [Cardiocondyla obscurior]|uniref:Uncharacterized protein n=1 Tax=Cardiocondyla obscurior TaxID=286306 RepID=A0AAW2G7D9_9HYME
MKVTTVTTCGTSCFPERRTERRLQGGPDRSGSERLDNYRKLHTDPPVRSSDVILRKLENDLDRERKRDASEPLLRFDPVYCTRMYRAKEKRERERRGGEKEEGEEEKKREKRLHTFSHGTKRRNKRVGWSRPAVYGALHLLAPCNPPRARAREQASEQTRPVWSHLTSDFAFDSLLANGSRISIRLPWPCLSYMICRDERNLLLCNFSSPATSTEAREAGAPIGSCAIEIEIEIGIEVGWR